MEETVNDLLFTVHTEIQGWKTDLPAVKSVVKDWLDRKIDAEGLNIRVNRLIAGKPAEETEEEKKSNASNPPATSATPAKPGLTGAAGADGNASNPPAGTSTTNPAPAGASNPPASDATPAQPGSNASAGPQNDGKPLQQTGKPEASPDDRKPANAARTALATVLNSFDKRETAKAIGHLLSASGNMADVVPSLMEGLIAGLVAHREEKGLVVMVANLANKHRKMRDGSSNATVGAPPVNGNGKAPHKGKDKGKDKPAVNPPASENGAEKTTESTEKGKDDNPAATPATAGAA